MPWIAVLAFFVLVVVGYYFWRAQNGRFGNSPSEDNVSQTFNFNKDGKSGPTRRNLQIVVPEQMIDGKRRRVRVELKALPAMDKLQPPPEKKIDQLITAVANPVVLAADSDKQIVDFKPPITVTISYEKEDAALTKSDEKGLPQLSIITVYEIKSGWKFEKLATVVKPNSDTGGGTLTAQLDTLEPGDPFWIGAP